MGVCCQRLGRDLDKTQDVKVAVISTSLIPTPPKGYGGIELLVGYLVRGLEESGIKVRLYGYEGSMEPSLGLVTGSSELELAEKCFRDYINGEVDIVLDWSHMKPYSLMGCERVVSQVFYTDSVGINPVFPSRIVASMYMMPGSKVIYPGIDISEYRLSRNREDWFIFFGRIRPEKGIEKVISIARMAGIKLKIAGHTGRFAEKSYVEKIKSMCSGQIEFIGEVSKEEKIDLLSHAKGLLYWGEWVESFGIFITEALASGCPCIVSSSSGGPAEQVIHGETGFICPSIEYFLKSIREVDKIDPAKCRSRAEYFSYNRMTNDWIKYISKLFNIPVGGNIW